MQTTYENLLEAFSQAEPDIYLDQQCELRTILEIVDDGNIKEAKELSDRVIQTIVSIRNPKSPVIIKHVASMTSVDLEEFYHDLLASFARADRNLYLAYQHQGCKVLEWIENGRVEVAQSLGYSIMSEMETALKNELPENLKEE